MAEALVAEDPAVVDLQESREALIRAFSHLL